MYLVHIYAYPYKYTYIQVLMAQNSCISQPYIQTMFELCTLIRQPSMFVTRFSKRCALENPGKHFSILAVHHFNSHHLVPCAVVW